MKMVENVAPGALLVLIDVDSPESKPVTLYNPSLIKPESVIDELRRSVIAIGKRPSANELGYVLMLGESKWKEYRYNAIPISPIYVFYAILTGNKLCVSYVGTRNGIVAPPYCI